MHRRMAEKVTGKAAGLGESGVFQPIRGVLTDELVICRAEA